MLGFGYGLIHDQVQKREECLGSFPIVTQVDLAGVYRAVSHDTHYVEGLLHPRVEPAPRKRTNILVNILSGLTQLLAELLNRLNAGMPRDGGTLFVGCFLIRKIPLRT